jgi:hypothetical protein
MLTRTLLATLLLASLSCKHGTIPVADGQSPDRAPRTILIGQPCAGLQLGSDPLDADARLFVEVAEVTTPNVPHPIGHWLEGRAVEARSTAHLVAFPNVPTTTPWGQCFDAVCNSAEYALTVTAHLPAHASDPISLTVRIDQAPAKGEAPTSSAEGDTRKVLLDTAIEAKNQEPALLPASSEVSRGSLVITPYLLRRYDDLHRILECSAGQSNQAPGNTAPSSEDARTAPSPAQ